jgi:hypothetical protein
MWRFEIMQPLYRLWLSVVFVALFSCSPQYFNATYAQPTQKPVPFASKAVLSMDGRGGKVTLGDKLEQAKRAFPPPRGAQISDARNYAIFQRDGWSWVTEKPVEAFEVSIKEGKIVGITRSVVMPSEKSRRNLIEQTIRKIGNPTAKAAGKTVSIYAWNAKLNARFLIEMKEGFWGSGPMVMAMIGDQDELKMFNYRVDDLETTVKQMDMGAEAMKHLSEKRNAEYKR